MVNCQSMRLFTTDRSQAMNFHIPCSCSAAVAKFKLHVSLDYINSID